MTPRLPPDIDRMLWEIAESQDTHAYDDFEKRFPQLVGELGKRIQLVRELREARGNGPARPLPQFDRRDPARMGLQPKALVVICAATVVCLGFGAYVVTGRLTNRPTITPPEPVQLGAPGTASPLVLSPSPGPKIAQSESSVVIPRETPPPPSPPQAPYLVLQKDVKVDRAKLQVAILLVATSGKLDVEFAPNMPNPDIRMEYHNMSALDIIKDLGPRFGFTAFREGGNKILLIPQVDPNATTLPPATGSGYAADIESGQSTMADPSEGKAGPVKPAKPTGPS